MAGYSGKPLADKLGIKPGWRVFVENGPPNYHELVDPLPEGASIVRRRAGALQFVHLFVTDATELAERLSDYRQRIAPDSIIWVSWPKKAAKVPTDVTENVVRDIALPMGLVDTKVCAVDDTWSGLKLVIRREYRAQ